MSTATENSKDVQVNTEDSAVVVTEKSEKDAQKPTAEPSKTEVAATESKGSASKKKSSSKKSSKSMTPIQAMHAAQKGNEPQNGASTFFLSLAAIDLNDNPRHEPANCFDEGYVLIGTHPTWTPPERPEGMTDEEYAEAYFDYNHPCLRDLALSKDLADVAHFVHLIETYESVDRKENPNAPQSITELAIDLRNWATTNKNGHGQFVPAFVKQDRGKWSLIDGGRRSTAVLYNHAVDRLAKANEEKDAPSTPYPAVLLCLDATGVTPDKYFDLSNLINMSRKDMDPLQEGKMYHAQLQQTNPETGKKYTLKELHAKVQEFRPTMKYSTLRNRVALWDDYKPAKRDEEGNIVSKARGLTDTDRRKVATGEMTATAASRKSLGERHSTPRPAPGKGPRRRTLTLSDIEEKFDSTPDSKKEFKEGLAFCMGISYKQACEESNNRLAELEEDEISDNQPTTGKGKKGKKAA